MPFSDYKTALVTGASGGVGSAPVSEAMDTGLAVIGRIVAARLFGESLGGPGAPTDGGGAAPPSSLPLVLAGEVRTVVLDWRAIDVAPGDRVTIAGEPGAWRVRSVCVPTDAQAADVHRRLRVDVVKGVDELVLIGFNECRSLSSVDVVGSLCLPNHCLRIDPGVL